MVGGSGAHGAVMEAAGDLVSCEAILLTSSSSPLRMLATLRARLHTLGQQGRLTTAGLGVVATSLLAACGPQPVQSWEMVATTEARATLLADTASVPDRAILGTASIAGFTRDESDWRGTIVLTTEGLQWQWSGPTGPVGAKQVLPLSEIGPIEVRREGSHSVLRLMPLRTGKPIEISSFGSRAAFDRLADDVMDLQMIASQGITPTPAILASVAQAEGRVKADSASHLATAKALTADVEAPISRTPVDLVRGPDDYRQNLYDATMVLSTARVRFISNDRSQIYQVPLRDVGAITVDGSNSFAYAVLDSDYPLVINPDSYDRRSEWHRAMRQMADASILARTTAAAATAPQFAAAMGRPTTRPLAEPSGRWAELEETRIYTGTAELERDKDSDTFYSAQRGRVDVTSRRVVFENADALRGDLSGRWTQMPLMDLDAKGAAVVQKEGRELRLATSADFGWTLRDLQPMTQAEPVAGKRTADIIAGRIEAMRRANVAIWTPTTTTPAPKAVTATSVPKDSAVTAAALPGTAPRPAGPVDSAKTPRR